MTRNNNSKSAYSPSHSTLTNTNSHDDNFINLPDLSGLKDDEKQHILNVLLRDENLRNKHLSRFMQLRKEVADLEQKSETTSASICARCQTPFGFIFNTGGICPKCGAKVCKQCRLIYNVNDNGWLCKLCCKQMQLMSYSGEWIYPHPNDLRKKSITASEIVRKSLTPQVSTRNANDISSSDTETEDTTRLSNRNHSSLHRTKPNQQNPNNNNIDHMVVQSSTDEQKLNSLKQNTEKRPYHVPLSQRTRALVYSSNTPGGGSSDDVDSLYEQSINNTDHTSSSSIHINTNDEHQERNSSIPKSTESLLGLQNQTDHIKNNNINKQDVDCASVTSSEWGLESERGEPTLQRNNASIKRNSKQSLSSRLHLTDSIQSLRDTVHRIPKPHLSASRTSLNSEQKSKAEILDTTSTKTSDKQNTSSMYPTWSSG